MKQLKYMGQCLKISLGRFSGQAALFFLLCLPGMVLPAFFVAQERMLIDQLSGEGTLPVILWHLGALIGGYLLFYFFDVLSKHYMEFGYFQNVGLELDAMLHRKAGKLSVESYDSPEIFRTLEQGRMASDAVIFSASLFNMILQTAIMILLTSSYLVSLHPLLAVFVALIAAAMAAKQAYKVRYNQMKIAQNAQPQREREYFQGLLTAPATAREIKTGGSQSFFVGRWKNGFQNACQVEENINQKSLRLGLSLHLLMAFCHVLAFLILVFLLWKGSVTLGGFTAAFTCFVTISFRVRGLLESAGEIMQTASASENFFVLINQPEPDRDKPLQGLDELQEIAFENVSYAYPGQTKPTLQNLRFSLKKGEHLALVGLNGSGKTTLVKLLCGMFSPTEGQIFINRKPREQYTEREILEQISAVYQNYGHYKLTLKDNLQISDPRKPVDEDKMRRVLERAHLSSYSLDQPFGVEFGGMDLSEGLWQRVAVARCEYRERPVLFMDEPTAAIDPMEEARFFAQFEEQGKNKTTVLVSHRLGAVRKARKILFLENGRIAEQGSFEELLRRNGKFAFLWNEQAKWYREDHVDQDHADQDHADQMEITVV